MQTIRFSTRATNLTLFLGLALAALSGFGAFLAGNAGLRWVLWIHAMAGFSIGLLLIWKGRIIARSLRRHGFGAWALPSLLLLLLLLASLLSGLFWASTGLPDLQGISGLTLHAAISAALVLLVLPHALAGWPRGILKTRIERRGFLRTGLVLAAGLALWRGAEASASIAGLSGAQRRFTGSRPSATTPDGDFPANSWLLDDPEPIQAARWRVQIRGAVARPLSLGAGDLASDQTWSVTIDCTGGWYSVQDWQGTPLSVLLAQATPQTEARSVVVRSLTGYSRRFSLAAADHMLLATRVGGGYLTHEHGAPARLVVPGRRGYDWVKWVTSIEASALPAWFQWPLPLS